MPTAGDHQLKRLDHLQAIAQRLAGNSFLLKGWAITLASAILGFALKEPATTASLAYLAIVPVLTMWGLDAYFLALERSMRGLYNTGSAALRAIKYADDAAEKLPDPQIVPGAVGPCRWLCATITPATSLLYLALLLIVIAVGSGLFTELAKKVVITV